MTGRPGYRTMEMNQARKRHININLFVRLVLGRPRDKPGFSPYFTQWKPRKPGFVPGTNLVCPWDNPGDEGRHRKFMWKKCMCLFCSLMNGGSSVSYLACTPCVPWFCTSFIGVEAEALLDYQEQAGVHFHCTVEPSPGIFGVECWLLSISGARGTTPILEKKPLRM